MGITDLAAFGINDIPANGDEKREGFQSKSIPSEIAATLESLQPDQIEERKKEEEHEALFTYQPLDPLKSEIRILTLRYSPNFSDPLVADLVVGSLDGAQVHPNIWTYTALSYTWGPPVFDGSITLNGRLFPITKNLEIALRYMRKSNSDYSHASFRRLGDTAWWIDQICINQQDIEERSSQVSLMRRIYKRATSVSVWLGESSPDSSRAIDLLTAIGRPPINAPGEKKIVYPEFSAEDVCKNWRALKNLLERPWWERVWIRQEVALSNSVKLWVGERCCEMELLAPTLGVINYLQNMGIEVPVQDGVDDADDDKTVEGEIGGLKLPWDYHGQQLQSLRGMTSGGFAWVELENLLPAGTSRSNAHIIYKGDNRL
ncbi:HET-domain-containing protein [Lojkania enalia]|uniref:HET-domain-containing protein n=1 Tax=Lojkania enalia TaxID=147567 RepID=A0A9P4KDD3_9PLEO|nr:HET-domain-containing protein [Didymosphaeria enalia]